jgi:hypothetical protein
MFCRRASVAHGASRRAWSYHRASGSGVLANEAGYESIPQSSWWNRSLATTKSMTRHTTNKNCQANIGAALVAQAGDMLKFQKRKSGSNALGRFYFSSSSAGHDEQEEQAESLSFHVADPQALLNAIASTYSSMSRILMEYIDNAIDDVDRRVQPDFAARVHVDIDLDKRSVWIRDNCGGIGHEGLLRLISGVGKVGFGSFYFSLILFSHEITLTFACLARLFVVL